MLLTSGSKQIHQSLTVSQPEDELHWQGQAWCQCRGGFSCEALIAQFCFKTGRQITKLGRDDIYIAQVHAFFPPFSMKAIFAIFWATSHAVPVHCSPQKACAALLAGRLLTLTFLTARTSRQSICSTHVKFTHLMPSFSTLQIWPSKLTSTHALCS